MNDGMSEPDDSDLDLCDGDVRLRFYQHRDAEAVELAFADETCRRFLPISLPFDLHHAQVYVAERMGEVEPQPWPEISFVIADANTNILLGEVRVTAQNWHRSELHYWLTPAARGRGVATRAVRLASDWAFEEQHDQRVEIPIRPDNVASIRVAGRAGFQYEGIREGWLTNPDLTAVAALCYVKFPPKADLSERR